MPDWFHPNTPSYWEDSIKGFWDVVNFDGLWTDMNEVSNFCNEARARSARTPTRPTARP